MWTVMSQSRTLKANGLAKGPGAVSTVIPVDETDRLERRQPRAIGRPPPQHHILFLYCSLPPSLSWALGSRWVSFTGKLVFWQLARFSAFRLVARRDVIM